MNDRFEDMLTGGHPNSLGQTIGVVDRVLADPHRVSELFNCYQSSDTVVRLRVSNALRRVQKERPDLLTPFLDRLIDEIGALDQASAQWTLPKLFAGAEGDMTADQHARAEALVKRNLAKHHDWIVLNNSIEYLAQRAAEDDALRHWLRPHLIRLTKETRKSVARRATKALKQLEDK